MKKIIFLILIVHCSLFTILCIGQSGSTILIYKGGQVINVIKASDFDSIKFSSCFNNCGIIKDYDGNVYNTVIIGLQCWMQKNLNTTHYSNGTSIPNVTDSIQWNSLTSDAYCNYNNDSTYAVTYGRMYNWYAASNNNNICPAGWHVPSVSEWSVLLKYLGDSAIAGGKLKEAGTLHWHVSNGGATNSSGFTALPGGLRDVLSNNFDSLGKYISLWSITNINANMGGSLTLVYYDASTFLDRSYKESGFNIRCVQNK